MLEKVQEFVSKYLVMLVAILLGIIGIFSFFFTAYFQADYKHVPELTLYRLDNVLWNVLGILIVLGIVFVYCKIVKKINIWVLLSIVLGLAFVTQLIYIVEIAYIPVADQYNICYNANLMLDGKIKELFVPGSYLNYYPFQTWITGFIAIMFKIFGRDNYLAFQVLNVIASVSNMALLFLITRKLFKKEMIQKLFLLLLLGFNLYFVFFNVHVYGNIIGLTFSLLAIYTTMLYMEKKNWLWIVLSGIFITIAILFKSNYNIFLCGIIFTLLLYAMQQKSGKPILALLGVAIIYLGITKTTTIWLERKIEQPLPKGVPMLSYVYMGIADKATFSSGWYTEDTIKIYDRNHQDTQAATEETKTLLKQRAKYWIEHPGKAFGYLADKEASTWLNPTFQTIWCSLPNEINFDKNPGYQEHIESKKGIIEMLNGTWYQIEEGYFNIYQIVIFGFGATGMCLYTRKKVTPTGIFLPMLFIGGFVFHLIWETKAIYVLQYYFLVLPFAGYGLYKIMEWGYQKFSHKKLLENVSE